MTLTNKITFQVVFQRLLIFCIQFEAKVISSDLDNVLQIWI
jgi:hypothetical protein